MLMWTHAGTVPACLARIIFLPSSHLSASVRSASFWYASLLRFASSWLTASYAR